MVKDREAVSRLVDTLVASIRDVKVTGSKPGCFNPAYGFRWAKDGREEAMFSRKPYTNITVDLTILGGKVPVFDHGEVRLR